MPFFRVTLVRHVSRVVELRQSTEVIVGAPSAAAAAVAVNNLAYEDEELVNEYSTGWADIDSSKQPYHDKETRRPSPQLIDDATMPRRDPWLKATLTPQDYNFVHGRNKEKPT
jgi:hypothetical protein